MTASAPARPGGIFAGLRAGVRGRPHGRNRMPPARNRQYTRRVVAATPRPVLARAPGDALPATAGSRRNRALRRGAGASPPSASDRLTNALRATTMAHRPASRPWRRSRRNAAIEVEGHRHLAHCLPRRSGRAVRAAVCRAIANNRWWTSEVTGACATMRPSAASRPQAAQDLAARVAQDRVTIQAGDDLAHHALGTLVAP